MSAHSGSNTGNALSHSSRLPSNFDPNNPWGSDGDDDMDFTDAEMTTDTGGETPMSGPTDSLATDEFSEGEYQDAQDFLEALEAGEGGIEIEIEESNEEQDSQAELETGEEEDDDDNDNDEDEEGEQTETETTTQTESPTAEPASGPRRMITRNMLLQLLGHENLRQIFADPSALTGGESDEGTTSGGWGLGRLRSRNTGSRPVPPQPPFKEGQELQRSGIYGRNERQTDTIKRRKKMQYRIMQRELGLGSPARHRSIQPLIAQSLIPSSEADTIIHYDSRCYSGQFSDDGNFFFSCAQDFKVRMYDTSNPYHWKYYKTVNYPYGQWTITDASLSPDNKFLAYSSIRSIVCLAPTDPLEKSDPYLLDFADTGGRGSRGFGGYSHFGIWSLRFSGDGREIVAGTSDRSVYVYDIETRKSILRIPGHDDDVNAVCFGDKSSPHVLFSGSDDSTLKVWDRRSLGEGREAGVFIGHTEGLTYVDSKGDGRYVLSNGKDQSMKLWDLRKMISTEKAERIDNASYSQGFDYRFMPYNEAMYRPHPHDCSVVSFRGHRVLKTLIRCHFSPPGSTDSRYVCSGSEDGKVWIYNIDGTLAGKVDVNRATKDSRPRNDALFMETYDMEGGRGEWKTCVRDASWHPNAPVVAATSWNGHGMSAGTCTVHSFTDGLDTDEAEPKMGARVDERLNHDDALYGGRTTGHRGAAWGRGARARVRRVVGEDE